MRLEPPDLFGDQTARPAVELARTKRRVADRPSRCSLDAGADSEAGGALSPGPLRPHCLCFRGMRPLKQRPQGSAHGKIRVPFRRRPVALDAPWLRTARCGALARGPSPRTPAADRRPCDRRPPCRTVAQPRNLDLGAPLSFRTLGRSCRQLPLVQATAVVAAADSR
jgi:hypothetical protein